MKILVFENAKEAGEVAAGEAAQAIRQSIQHRGEANIILATGTSQFETLDHLIAERGIDWSKVRMFHLDEYIGLPVTHPASFRKYLRERFLSKVQPLKESYLINGEGDPNKECRRLGTVIHQHPVDVALVGVGENGHLAFNDPPADFNTRDPYIVVSLDDACRNQQLGEGWFKSLEEVPRQAISMSINQIMKAGHIVCSVPDSRKAKAVKASLEGPVTPDCPASILQQHPRCTFYLDRASAVLLSGTTFNQA